MPNPFCSITIPIHRCSTPHPLNANNNRRPYSYIIIIIQQQITTPILTICISRMWAAAVRALWRRPAAQQLSPITMRPLRPLRPPPTITITAELSVRKCRRLTIKYLLAIEPTIIGTIFEGKTAMQLLIHPIR